MQNENILDRDRKNIVATLYFCEKTNWTELRRWIRPRIGRERFNDAMLSLIRDGIVVVEKVKRWGCRPAQFLRLSEDVVEYEFMSNEHSAAERADLRSAAKRS